ncbi:MAG: hypothetical protein ABI837_14365 [Acidobacteriota bacterium]
MTDFDWIGVEWIAAAFYLLMGAVACAVAGLWLKRRSMKRAA